MYNEYFMFVRWMVLGMEGVMVFCFGSITYVMLIRSYAIYYVTTKVIKRTPPDKVIFNCSNGNLDNHEKLLFL